MSEKQPTSVNKDTSPTNQELKDLNWSDVDPVIDTIQARRESVKSEIDDINAVSGFKYDGGEMGKKQAIRRIEQSQENVAIEDEWKQYGGEAIDEAQAAYDANEAKGFNKSLGDRIVLQAKLNEAKKRYYLNHLSDFPKEDEKTDLTAQSVSNVPQGAGIDVTGKEMVLYAPEFNGEARDTFLEYIAKREKGHWNSGRIKYGGKFHQLLNHIGAKGLAEKLTSTTEEEKRLSGEYTALVKAWGDRALASYEKGSDEYYAKRAGLISHRHAADVAKIAELQKEDAKKPLSKLLRKAGYVAAGVAGGAVAMSPLGAIVGAAGALSAAAGIRVWANKRNALTKAKEGEGLEVDRVAQLRQADFTKRASSEELREDYDFDNVAGEHLADMHEEVEKNRKRLRRPLAATALSLLATRGIIYTAEAFSGDPGPATDSSFSVSEGIKNKLPSIDHSLDHPPMPSAPEAPTGYDYPWSWMADVAGPEQASGELHRLGEIASQNGYDVVWHALGDGIDTNDQISINGISDTDYVVNILNQFR